MWNEENQEAESECLCQLDLTNESMFLVTGNLPTNQWTAVKKSLCFKQNLFVVQVIEKCILYALYDLYHVSMKKTRLRKNKLYGMSPLPDEYIANIVPPVFLNEDVQRKVT